jgi:GH35 family endo-1,4-beta-xylanase
MIGSSVNKAIFNDNQYLNLLIEHFDWWYYDQGFKWQGDGNDLCRKITDLALFHGKKLRGNNLASATFQITRGEITNKLLTNHLEITLQQFPDIIFWDAVHESTADNGFLRRCIWRECLGDDWEAKIFQMAHKIAPEVNLFYCDYFRDKRKWSAVYDKISFWLGNKIPVHGISIQLHSNLRPSVLGKNASLGIEQAEYWMKKFKSLGLIVHVPEIVVWQPSVTVDILNFRGKANLYKEVLRKGMGHFLLFVEDVEKLQAKVYGQIIDACVKANVDMVGFWSAFDKYPWNWIGNRAKAGFWNEEFIAKKNLEILKNYRRKNG